MTTRLVEKIDREKSTTSKTELKARLVALAHEIGFDSAADTITLRHTARSREGFARGALRAARWVAGKKGVFEFREILGELG